MTSFNIFYNEEWHITMFEMARTEEFKSIIYFVFMILFGQVLFIRLLTAIFLNEFGKLMGHIEQQVKPVE